MARRVLSTSLVAPSPAGPERSLPLTYLDALWTHATPVERVFFYPGATPDVVPALLDSLSRALAAFYPLAGRLRLTPGTPNRYEIYYQPGDAVTFTVAECDDHVSSIEELAMVGHPTKVAEIVPLVPPLPEGGAVLALQATVLHGGLSLGITYHHAACDGASLMHFLHTWAWAATASHAVDAAGAAPEPPVIERTFITIPLNDDHILVKPRPSGGGGPSKSRDADAGRLLATFTLSKEQLQSVKDTVAREAERRGVPTPRSTSTVAAFGLLWQCYALARPSRSEEPKEEDRSYFLFMADHRARLKVPASYLGNCISPCMASAPIKDVRAAGAGGLFTACAAVGAAVEHVLRGGPEYWDGWRERVREAFGAGEMPLAVAGSPRFRVYEVDLGFGRPAMMNVVSAARTDGIAVGAARAGGGGLEIGVSLPPAGMARFQKCFGDAIATAMASSSPVDDVPAA